MKYPRLHHSVKKGILICSLQILAAIASAQYRYAISGKLAEGAGKTLYISADTYIPNADKRPFDSIVVSSDDSFKLSGEVEYAGLYSMFINDQGSFLVFYLDTTPVTITGSSNAVYQSNIKGAIDQDLINQFQVEDGEVQQQLEKKLNKVQSIARRQPVDTPLIMMYRKQIDSLNKIRATNVSRFMVSYPNSYLTFQNIESFMGNLVSYDTAEKYLDNIPDKYVANPLFKKISKLVAGYKTSATGALLPDIDLPDTTNTLVSFKTLRASNKYLLLDFWASWCVPCRANNPALQRLYNRYKNKQFEIAGVSLDENGDAWKKAIRKDNMKWIQLSDLKGMDNEYAVRLGIRSIPTYLLIDSSGRLLLKTHKVQDIEEKMKQLF